MSLSSEECSEIRQGEIEALRSIFDEGLIFDEERPDVLVVRIRAKTIPLDLAFRTNEKYPEEVPTVTLSSNALLSASFLEALSKYLLEKAEERRGMPMIYDLVTFAQEELEVAANDLPLGLFISLPREIFAIICSHLTLCELSTHLDTSYLMTSFGRLERTSSHVKATFSQFDIWKCAYIRMVEEDESTTFKWEKRFNTPGYNWKSAIRSLFWKVDRFGVSSKLLGYDILVGVAQRVGTADSWPSEQPWHVAFGSELASHGIVLFRGSSLSELSGYVTFHGIAIGNYKILSPLEFSDLPWLESSLDLQSTYRDCSFTNYGGFFGYFALKFEKNIDPAVISAILSVSRGPYWEKDPKFAHLNPYSFSGPYDSLVYLRLAFSYSLLQKSNMDRPLSKSAEKSKGKKGKEKSGNPLSKYDVTIKYLPSKSPRFVDLIRPLGVHCQYTKKLEKQIRSEIPSESLNGFVYTDYWVLSTAAAEDKGLALQYQKFAFTKFE